MEATNTAPAISTDYVFGPSQAYKMTSACDSNAKWFFEMVKRSRSRVTLRNIDTNEVVTVGVHIHEGREICFPLGRYSMAPVLRA